MLKTIKTTKQIRLDELIKYIYNENIENKTFTDLKNEVEVSTNIFGSVSITNKNNPKLFVSHNRLFTVEVEEPITEDTLFEKLFIITKEDNFYTSSDDRIRNSKQSFSFMRGDKPIRIYAKINGKIELVWEEDN